MRLRPSATDWLFLAALVIAWGSSFAMTKIAVADLSASWIMALRLLVAGALLVPYAAARGVSFSVGRRIWSKFAWLGFVGHAAPFFLISWGTRYTTSGVAGLLMGTIPLILVVAAHFTLPGERLTPAKAAGFVLGFAGLVVLVGPDAFGELAASGSALRGELAIFAGCLCYVTHAITAKRLGSETPLLQTAAVCAVGGLMGLAFAAVADPAGPWTAPSSALWSVVGLGIFPTALASLILYHLLDRTGPSFIAYSNYLVPVYALLLGAVLLGESLSWNIAVATAMILCAIAVSRLGSRPSG